MVQIKECVGRTQPFVKVQSPPIAAQRAPTTADTAYPKGASWIDESVSPSILYWHIGGGVWNSNELTLSTDATFAAALDTTASSSLAIKTYADALAIAGAPDASTTVKGIAELCTTAEATTGTDTARIMTAANVASVFAAPPATGSGTPAAGSFTTLAATGAIDFDAGGSFESGGATIDIGADASADAINVGTGAAARVITVGNVTGATQVVLNSGTAGIALASTGAGDITINSDDTLLLDADGVLELNSSAGAIGIGSDADAQAINIGTGAAARTITVGNATGASSFVVTAGTGAVNIGVNAIAHTTTIGNKTGASSMVLDTGTGNFALNGVGATTYTVGAATTSGTIDIGGTAQTGTMTLGDSSGTNIVQIGSGEGGTTVNIAGGATNAKTVNIATGAVANLVTIGSASGAAALDLLCGTGDFTIDGAATSTYTVAAATTTGTVTIGGTAQSGTMTLGDSSATNIVQIGSGEGASTVNIAGGATSGKFVNIATGAVANAVVIGSASGASSMDLIVGTGDFTLEGDVASTYDISSTGINTGTVTIASGTGARTVEIAGGGTGIKTVNIGTGATADVITIGTTTAAGSTTIAAGTGDIILTGNVKTVTAEHIVSLGTDLTVTQSPILQASATTGVAPTGVAGAVNIMMMQDGCMMEQFIIGTQTIIAPRMSATGLDIELDNINAEGAEYNFGAARTNSKHAYTIGTSAAFFFSATLTVEDLSGCAPLMIGFRKAEANNATLASYTDYFCAGLNSATSGTEVILLDELNGGGQTITNSTTVWTGGDTGTCTIKVLVSAAGVCTYTIDAGAPAATNAVTFDTADVVVPFIHFVNGADVAGAVSLNALSCGFQAQ